MNERLLRGVLKFSLSNPRSTLALWLAACLLVSPLVLALRISTSTDSVLHRGTDSWHFYQNSISLFSSDEVLVAALAADVPFAPLVLGALAGLTAELEELEGVRRVDSLASTPLVTVLEDGSLELAPLLGSDELLSLSDVEHLRDRVESDVIVRDSLLSRDGRLAALNIQLELDLGDRFDTVVQGVRQVVEDYNAWVSGVPVFRAEINRRAGMEIGQFVLFTVAVVTLVLFLLLRSALAVAIAVGAGAVGTWSVLAALGATGTPLTLVTVILPSIMMALGCAYSMHLISASRGANDGSELHVALAEVVPPTALSGLTTAIGFVAIAAVQIDAIRQVGIFGAFGVLVVVSACLSAVPAALSLKRVGGRCSHVERWVLDRLAKLLYEFSSRHSKLIVGGTGLVCAFLALGLIRAEVETDVTQWFPRGSHVRDSYEEIRGGLSGISPMNMVIRSTEGSIVSPANLTAIAAMTDYLNSSPDVGKAISVADPLRQLHQGFTQDPKAGLPRSAELIEQYLLLLETVPYLADLVTGDRSAANISLRVNENGSKRLLRLAALADEWWGSHGPPGTEARMTGIMFEFARAEDEIALGQVRGIGFALLTIFVLMWSIFQSYRLALVAMIPNVLPLIMVFGLLGLLGVGLDAGLVVSACLVLGIAVDNTIHLITALQREVEREVQGGRSLRTAMEHVIVPVVVSTLALGLGFVVLGGSGFVFVRNLGLLVVFVMFICCVADLVLLPALLMLSKSQFSRRGENPAG